MRGTTSPTAFFLLAALVVGPAAAATSLTPSESFTADVSLVANDVYHMFWKSDSSTITIEVHVAVKGWVGFGISPNGGMTNADIVIGYVKDGVAYFSDRYSTTTSMPTIDSSQDWKLLAASETSTHTVLKFKRPLYTCDSEDRNITAETMKVIFAYSTTDPSSEAAVSYHGTTRGAKSLMLLSTHSTVPTMPSDAVYVDYMNANVTIPHSSDTTYWCTGFVTPTFSQKHHLIKIEPIIDQANLNYVHHIILYACFHTPTNITNDQTGFVCYTPNIPHGECDSPIVAWAFGGTAYAYPDHVGFPFGETSGGVLYMRMETHYDNPNLNQGVVDGSGLRLWFTPTLRQYDAGLLEVGMQVNPIGQIIPGGYTDLLQQGHCTKECLSEAMGSQQDFKVFSAVLHAHLLGTGVRVHHYRNGTELSYLDSDLAYDFNYQETRVLSPEVTVQNGDNLVVDCHYNSAHLTNATVAGLGTKNEMCLAYLWYYPKINVTKCESTPTQTTMATELSFTFSTINDAYGPIAYITSGSYANKRFDEYMAAVGNFETNQETKTKYQNAILTGTIWNTCMYGTDTPLTSHKTVTNVPTVSTTYTPPTEDCGQVADAGIASGTLLSSLGGAESIKSLSALFILTIALVSAALW